MVGFDRCWAQDRVVEEQRSEMSLTIWDLYAVSLMFSPAKVQIIE